MKQYIKHSLIAIALVLLVGLAGLLGILLKGGPRSYLAGFDKGIQEQYERIDFGTPREEVITKLGSPLRSKETFCLPSGHKGYKESLTRANNSNAVSYDLWLNGMNWYYCIGGDESGLLVIKAEGHD